MANPDTSNWDTSSVTSMADMFLLNDVANPNTNNWDTSSVTNMNQMFYKAYSSNPNTENWIISNVTDMNDMFHDVTLATITYDHILIDFNNSVVETGIVFNGGNSKYCSAEAQAARNNLINNFNWTITDGGLCIDSNIFDDFVIKVTTDNSGSTNDLRFKIPTKPGLTYDYNVDCDNDGTNEATGENSSYTCVYASAGTYIIRIKDNTGLGNGYPSSYSLSSDDKRKIISVLQWGSGKWQTMENAFKNAENVHVVAKDNPDLSNVTTLESMFNNAFVSNPDVSDWDVTTITDMTDMFKNVTLSTDVYDDLLLSFNAQNLQVGIDFNGGNSTYCAIDAHDNITNIATGHGWLVIDNGLGANCAQSDDYFIFSVDTNNTSAGSSSSTQFTLPTTGIGYNYDIICDAANPATSLFRARSANFTCQYPSAGTYTIKVSSNIATTETGTGFPHIYFNNEGDKLKIIEVSQWGTGLWASMESAFRGASNMIVTATDIPDLSQVLNMSQMFRFASNANPDVSNWDTSNVRTMELMFNGALAATPNISNWNVSNVDNMENMLLGLTLPTTIYDATLINFNLQNLRFGVTFNAGDSKYCAIAAHDNLINLSTFAWTITDGGLESNCPTAMDDFVITVITNVSGNSSPTQYTINTNGALFYDYSVDCDNDGINEVVAQASDYTCTYDNPGTYTIRIKYNTYNNNGFPIALFSNSSNKDKLLSIEQWGTNPWINLFFEGAINLTTTAIDIPNFTNVNTMLNMFKDASSAIPNTSNWDTSSVLMMDGMFYGASAANPDTSNWDTSSVLGMGNMFRGATSANPDTSNWDVTKVSDMTDMFAGVTLPTADYDAMLIGFNTQNLHTNVSFHGGNSKYCDIIVHENLESVTGHNWTITDGGLDPNCSNSDPTVTGLPTEFNVFEDEYEDLDLSATIIEDIDAGTGDFTVILSVTNGVLRHDIDGDGNYSPPLQAFTLITANLAAMNTLIQTPSVFQFKGDANLNGNNAAVLTIVANDNGNTGTGGGVDVNLGDININITAVNDAPSFSIVGDLELHDSDLISPLHYELANFTSTINFGPNDESNQSVAAYNVTIISDNDNIIDTATVDINGKLIVDFFDVIGEATLEIVLQDDGGTTNGGQDMSSPLQFTVSFNNTIFSDSFENTIVIFKSAEKSFEYDFSKIDISKLEQTPLLIAKGIDADKNLRIQIYLRKLNGVVQIRMNQWINKQWINGQWQLMTRKKLTQITF